MLKNIKPSIRNLFIHSETAKEAKEKWNALARKNARYFVLSTKQSESEEEFRATGQRDVRRFILDDEHLQPILAGKPLVLEIGCGLGRLSEFVAPHVGHLYATDISEEMIKQAKVRLAHIKNIDFLATDGVNYPLQDESVDTVFSYTVFQHMPTKEVVRKNIREISRVLKVGGIAKIHLREVVVSKNEWFYGPSLNPEEIMSMVRRLPLEVIGSMEMGKNFWVWLKKCNAS